MKAGRIYRLLWNTMDTVRHDPALNIASQDMQVDIYDNRVQIADDADEEIIPLKAAMDPEPLTISVINNDQDKFLQIRSKQAIIKFKSDTDNDIRSSTFSDAPDNNFYVEAFNDGATLFVGYLVLSEMSMPFQPDPQTVTLIASDHLPTLKDIALTDEDGSYIIGKRRIAEILALCLKKTSLTLNIQVVNNIRIGGGQMTQAAEFLVGGGGEQAIAMAGGLSRFFYTGQSLTVSGTASNDGTFTVRSVSEIGGSTIAVVDDTIVPEVAASATLTDDNSDGHFYDKGYLDIKTFEQQIGVSEDCYTVINKILGEDCFLFQKGGFWVIMRVDEYDGNPFYLWTFDADGISSGFTTADATTQSIGFENTACFVNADTLLQNDRPHNIVREVMMYEYPEELVCNEDFSRGDVITPPDMTLPESEGTYELDCWRKQKFPGFGTTIIPADNDTYIKRIFEYGVEVDRYIVLTSGPAYEVEGVQSQAIDIQQGDKMDISVEWRLASDVGPGDGLVSPHAFGALIITADGEYWYLTQHYLSGTTVPDGKTTWLGPFTEQKNQAIDYNFVAGDTDEREWVTVEVEAAPAPVTGKLYFNLYKEWQGAGLYETDTYMRSFRVDIIPVIQGSYNRYTGHHNQITRVDTEPGYLPVREKQVYIGDPPRPEMKGAIFIRNGGVYYPVAIFYSSNAFAGGYPPGVEYLHPYGYIQAYAVWNQYRNANRIFSGSVLGLGANYIDLYRKTILTDANADTENRYFMLISFSQPWKTGVWSGILVEVFRTDLGHVYSDPHEFKYLTNG